MPEKNGFYGFIRYLLGLSEGEDHASVWNSPASRRMLSEQWENDWNAPDPPGMQRIYAGIRESIIQENENRINVPANTFLRLYAGEWLLRVAAIILVLFLPAGIQQLQHYRSVEGISKLVKLEVTSGERDRLLLPDNTLVWLNGGSTLYYPQHFSGIQRRVFLEGEAFFDVQHDASRPFRLTTPMSDIHVKGTRFNTCDYPDDGYSETILVDGRVELGTRKQPLFYVLEPDQKWTIYEGNRQGSIETVDAGNYMAWISGKLIFENQLLEDICRRMDHWYGVKLDLSEELLGKYHLTLTVREESLETILRLMSKTIEIQWEYTSPEVIKLF